MPVTEDSATDGDDRRVYYDHEPAYRAIAEAGGRGWDDLPESMRGLDEDVAVRDGYSELERFLESRWAPPKGTRALDLGCGGGQGSIRLARAGYDVIGVDFSETAIELARQNADEAGVDCEFRVGDVTDLADLASDDFGLAIDNHTLHCLVEKEHRRAMLDEVNRLLRIDGVFFSETMTREGLFDPAKVGADPDTFISKGRTRIWVSKIELDEELRGVGFNIIHEHTHHDEPGFGLTFVNYALKR